MNASTTLVDMRAIALDALSASAVMPSTVPASLARGSFARARRATRPRPSPKLSRKSASSVFETSCRARARALREDGPLNDGFEDDDTGTIDSRAFFNASVAFYAVMTVGAQTLCAFADIHPDVIDGAFAFNVDAGALYTAPLLASLTFAVTQSEKYEFLREVRETFESRVLPATAPLGVVGIFGLSLGAGVGEEAMFRGFLMPWVDGRLESLGIGGDVASVAALASTSAAFGALHAITPAYAMWATWASVLFSLEYLRDGLGSAMFTHTLYDFLAFMYVIISWMPDREEAESRD